VIRRQTVPVDQPGINTGWRRVSCAILKCMHIYSGMSSARLRFSSAGDDESMDMSAPGALSRRAAAFTVNIGVLCSCLRRGTVPTITSTGSSKSRPGPDCVATNCTNQAHVVRPFTGQKTRYRCLDSRRWPWRHSPTKENTSEVPPQSVAKIWKLALTRIPDPVRPTRRGPNHNRPTGVLTLSDQEAGSCP